MRAGLLAAALALLAAGPAVADRPVAPAVAPYDPLILWNESATRPLGSAGRVRLIPHPEGALLLSLDQYWAWLQHYERALARLAFRMPVERARGPAAGQATAAFLAEARARGARLRGVRDAGVPLDLATPGPDYRVSPLW